ncbi:MAG: 3-oxoacyl-[acyl-carrier protein] reductase [Solirubrobacteraceae bacterium]|nr:3-oxoacyl-[acyl-carrier protein] reductase [Solirubrobacteraceae bacterium]
MSDRYQQLINTPIGRVVSKQVGLPQPVRLERHQPGRPVIDGPVLFGAAPGGRLAGAVTGVLAAVGAEVHTPMQEDIRTAAAAVGLEAKVFNPEAAPSETSFKALVFDATGIGSSEELHEAWAFFHPTIRRVRTSGRVIVLGTAPEDAQHPAQAVAQRALEGLTRSIGKEVRRGAAAQLVYVAPGAEDATESTLRFLLSAKSAYVSGQVVRINASALVVDQLDWERPLSGKVAVVTGASRGIGAAIADVLARDGAHVLGVDIPGQASDLDTVTGRIGGSSLALDITADGAPAELAAHLLEHHGGVDVVVHNAGITRDKTLGGMSDELWDSVLGVNLIAPQRIDRELFARKVIRANGRVVLVSSISGIAGNAGQTNYSTSKAGVIGVVQAWAAAVAEQDATINAVAPGFIETQMTAAMPIGTREAGRRMNSMAQGGLPVDVAETIAWYASPGSAGVNGNVVRVCGQSLLGA